VKSTGVFVGQTGKRISIDISVNRSGHMEIRCSECKGLVEAIWPESMSSDIVMETLGEITMQHVEHHLGIVDEFHPGPITA